MSVKLVASDRGFFLDHREFIDGLYADQNVKTKDIFDVRTPFRMDGEAARIAAQLERGGPENEIIPRKRRKKSKESCPNPDSRLCQDFLEDAKVREMFEPLVDDPEVIASNNRRVRKLVRELEQVSNEVASSKVLIPAGAEYVQDRIGQGGKSLSEIVGAGRKFSVLVADLPWDNRHVRRERRRGRGYGTEDNNEIVDLFARLGEVLEDDPVVAIWCNNAERTRNTAMQIFKNAGLHLSERWIWLKVTKSGEPIVPFNHPHKVPYEYVFVARRKSPEPRDKVPTKVICSVPSAVQSHKPPLSEILNKQFPGLCQRGKCLELFGRYLLPGWTTVGDQCLKFQHEIFFEKVK